MRFQLVTQHQRASDGYAVTTARATFPTWEAAKAAGEALSPELDGTTVPTLDADLAQVDSGTYESGLFWLGNRYAAIHKVTR